jgi:hypothetical protein
VLLTVKSNQKTLYRQIQSQFQGKRHIPFTASDHEKHHGRDTLWELSAKEAPEHIKENWPGSAWIVEVITETLTAGGKRTVRRHLFLTASKANKRRSKRMIFSAFITKKAIPITDLEVATSLVMTRSRPFFLLLVPFTFDQPGAAVGDRTQESRSLEVFLGDLQTLWQSSQPRRRKPRMRTGKRTRPDPAEAGFYVADHGVNPAEIRVILGMVAINDHRLMNAATSANARKQASPSEITSHPLAKAYWAQSAIAAKEKV